MSTLKKTVYLAMVALLWAGTAHAQQANDEKAVLFWGYDTTGDDHYGYVGAAIAPFGSINESGVRLRFFGYGANFDYDASPDREATGGGGGGYLGYSHRTENLSLPGYVGAEGRGFDIDPSDSRSDLHDENVGLPLLAELDYSFSERFSVSALANYTFLLDTYWTRLRPTFSLGWQNLRAGPEVTAYGGDEWDKQRYGAFLSGFRLGGVDIGVKVGAEYDSRDNETDAYGGVEMGFAF